MLYNLKNKKRCVGGQTESVSRLPAKFNGILVNYRPRYSYLDCVHKILLYFNNKYPNEKQTSICI